MKLKNVIEELQALANEGYGDYDITFVCVMLTDNITMIPIIHMGLMNEHSIFHGPIQIKSMISINQLKFISNIMTPHMRGH